MIINIYCHNLDDNENEYTFLEKYACKKQEINNLLNDIKMSYNCVRYKIDKLVKVNSTINMYLNEY